jgi:hypothetical protein
MDVETALGWLLWTAAIGWLVYFAFVAFAKQPAQTLAEFRKEPIFSIFAWFGVLGVLMSGIGIVSLGRLTFDIPMPWGSMKSQWMGGLLALLSIPAVLFRRKRRRV